ncbi:MAG: NADH-quinone oxidoreductase subunit N [bacterium]
MSFLLPEGILVVGGILMLLLDIFQYSKGKVFFSLTVIAYLTAMGILIGEFSLSAEHQLLSGMVNADLYGVMVKVLLLSIGLFISLIAAPYFGYILLKENNNSEKIYRSTPLNPPRPGDFFALLLFTTVGMTLLATANDLLVVFFGLETMSLGLYGLAGLFPERVRSGEAALKYLILGAFASAFMLMGIALIYGTNSGETHFSLLWGKESSVGEGITAQMPLYSVGIGLVWIGFLFKIAAVPFQFWAPDVYQGAPTPVTALMSTGPKAAAFMAFTRLFGWAVPQTGEWWQGIIVLVSIATMTLGNIAALSQSNIKRMLAYSSIAHAGYLLLAPLVVSSPQSELKTLAASALYFYLTVYYLMNLSAFAIAYIVNRARHNQDYSIADYMGLAYRHPWLAITLGVVMISLAGIPPTAGFFAKFYLFAAAVKAGYTWLVVIAVINSVISVYYYLRLVVYMFMKPLEKPITVVAHLPVALVMGISLIGLIFWGIFPRSLHHQSYHAAQQMLSSPPVETHP